MGIQEMGTGNGASERERRGCQRNRKRAENKVGEVFLRGKVLHFRAIK